MKCLELIAVNKAAPCCVRCISGGKLTSHFMYEKLRNLLSRSKVVRHDVWNILPSGLYGYFDKHSIYPKLRRSSLSPKYEISNISVFLYIKKWE